MFRLNLKTLREERRISQAVLAKELGVAQSAVGNWESGARSPDAATLLKIANYFDVTVDYLLTGEEKEHPTVAGVPLNDKELEWLRRFQQATPEVKNAALALLRAAEEAMKTIENIKEESTNAVKDLADSYANHDERP